MIQRKTVPNWDYVHILLKLKAQSSKPKARKLVKITFSFHFGHPPSVIHLPSTINYQPSTVIPYSERKLVTGFATAARIAW
jgi:hypothetical protein